MGGITCNAEGFAGETGAVDVLEGGESLLIYIGRILIIQTINSTECLRSVSDPCRLHY